MTTAHVSTIALICEKWTMTLNPPRDGHDEWFLDWVLRSPKNAGRHLAAGWLAYGSLLDVYHPDEISSVREFFGGMGAQSLMIQELFKPDEHLVGDYSPEAVEHLRRALPDHIHVEQQDAYDAGGWPGVDLVGLDFGDLTVWKTRDDEKHRDLLDNVFIREPKAVVLTDIACRYLHLHRERYETLLGSGTCASYPQYLGALFGRLRELYGYKVVRAYWDRWSTVAALIPEDVAAPRPLLFPTPEEDPVGLELL